MVLTVDFTVGGQQLQGLNGGPDFTFNEAVSFQISCADQDEVDYYWEKLLAGIEIGDDPNTVFAGANLALLVGARPRGR